MTDYFHSPLRYPGGKRRQLDQILPKLTPDPLREFNPSAFVEPFVGGGAVFWALLGMGKLTAERVILCERNPAVAAFYRVLVKRSSWPQTQRVLRALVDGAAENSDAGNEDLFAEVRNRLNGILMEREHVDDIDVAARIFFLNRTCMNGIVRMNRVGEFNVPIGRDSQGRPKRFTEDDIDRLAEAHYLCLRAMIEVREGDGVRLIQRAPKNAIIYVDPPYSGGFVEYTAERWSADDDKRLYAACAKASTDRGCRIVLSQPDTEWARACAAKYLPGFAIEEIRAPRHVNRNGHGRQPVGELIIWNKW